MADSHQQTAEVPVSGAELKRAERFARESFVLEGEDAATALAPGTARRRALDAALAEIEQGRDDPSLAWRREYSLMLGLERLLAEEEPHLADGTTLSAHQVDALSGTLDRADLRHPGVGPQRGQARRARPRAAAGHRPGA